MKTIFSFSNRNMGIPLMNNGPLQLAKCIGLTKAMEITLIDKEINASEAIECGLANEISADGTGRPFKCLNANNTF